MKIFLDTANLDEIREAAALGVVDGITTNPSLLAKETGDPEAILVEICETVDGPISGEVVATEADGMIKEGRHLASLHENVVVKIPCITEGLKATKILSGEGKRVNMTLVFSPTQALLAAKSGARYVSPFLGRLDDIAAPGMDLVADIIQIFDHYDFDCEVLAASLRHPLHVVEAARMGADIATMPKSVFDKLLKHPLTDIGLKRFLDDWEKVKAQLAAKAV
ncbi:MAG: fructose-6-phosphate aldolase [Acidobacteriota bacterium]|jgi:transaldolase|nr:fructose-6-phosphate aldolase [Acidobacteriota bacterium]